MNRQTYVQDLVSIGHVEIEDRGWVGAFNLSISLNTLFERILAWEDKEINEESVGLISASMLDVTLLVLEGVDAWHQVNVNDNQYSPTSDPSTVAAEMSKLGTRARLVANPLDVEHRCTPAALPVCLSSVQFGMSTLALPALSVSQVCPVSFHIPLHRFLGSCLSEVCRGSSYGIRASSCPKVRNEILITLDKIFLHFMTYNHSDKGI